MGRLMGNGESGPHGGTVHQIRGIPGGKGRKLSMGMGEGKVRVPLRVR